MTALRGPSAPPAPRCLCSRTCHATPPRRQGTGHAPNSMMGTTSADGPLAAHQARPCRRPPQTRGLHAVSALAAGSNLRGTGDMESRGRGALAPETTCFQARRAGRLPRTAPADAGRVVFAPCPRCHSGNVSPHSTPGPRQLPGRAEAGTSEVASKLMLVLSLEN